MREYITYRIYGDFNKCKEIKSKIDNVDLSNESEIIFNSYGLSIGVYKGSLREVQLRREVMKHSNVDIMVSSTKYEYDDDKKIEDFEFFRMVISWKGMNISDRDSSGTVYDDENKCSVCRFGENKKIGPLHINERNFGKRLISSNLATHFVVTEEFKELVETNNISGTIFEEVVGGKKGTPLKGPKRYLLLSSSILPKIVNEDIVDKFLLCKACKKGNLSITTKIPYTHKYFKNAKDFNFTKEYFGDAHVALQRVMISKKLYKLLSGEKRIARNLEFIPIRLY